MEWTWGAVRRTGSTTEIGTLCSFNASATTSIVDADASMPNNNRRPSNYYP